MTVTKLIPTTIWASLPELDLNAGDDLFPQLEADTYRPVRADVDAVVIPALTAGMIDQSSPNEGDVVTVSGSNAPAGATFQWQLGQSDIAGATAASINTNGLGSGPLRRGVSAGAQGPVYTSEVTLASAASVPEAFQPGDWSITDAGTGGDATVTINTLPPNGGFPIQIVQYSLDNASYGPIPGGANQAGTYALSGLFTDGIPQNIWLRAVNQNGPGPGNGPKSVTTTGGAPAPTATSVTAGVQGSDGVLPVDITGMSGNAPDSYFVITDTAQTGLTSAQVRAGTDAAGSPAASASGVDLSLGSFPNTLPLTAGLDGTYHGYLVLGGDQLNYGDPISFGSFALDTTAPQLTAPTILPTSESSVDWKVTTDQSGGVIYAAIRNAASPELTVQEIIEGDTEIDAQSQDTSPTAGANNGGTMTTLTPSTQYVADMVQIDAFGNQSAVVSSPSQNTPAPAGAGPQIVAHGLIDTDTPLVGSNYVHEFAGVPFGAENANRALSLIVLHKRGSFGGANGHDWSASSIGGVTANVLAGPLGNPGFTVLSAPVPNGTSGTVRLDVGQVAFAKGMAFALISHDAGQTVSVLASEHSSNDATIDLSATISANDAFLVAGAVTEGTSAGDITWSGLTPYAGAGYTDNASIVAAFATPRSFAFASPVAAGAQTLSASFGGAPNSNKNAAFVLEIV